MFTLNDFWKILNFLGTGENPDYLDSNITMLATSEQAKSTKLFENTIDQIAHSTEDYERLRRFLIDWYSSHKTIISTQKQASDVFSLPSNHLNELLKSFGFPFSVVTLPAITKGNFFLDLVNLYKVKGTPQALIDVLEYFGLKDIDLAEYWLEKDSNRNLVFRSERYLPIGVIDIPFRDIDFDVMTRIDPHWRLSKEHIENLLLSNKIALPSKSPYFSIRPRYNLTLLVAIMGLLKRYAQNEYEEYVNTGELNRTIRLTQVNYTVSYLELYLSCIYVFNSHFNRTTGSNNPSVYYYSGDDSSSVSDILTLHGDMISRSNPIFDSRSLRDNQLELFRDLFTSPISSLFLYGTDAENLIADINRDLYNILDTYLDAGSGLILLGLLLGNLDDWVTNNMGAGYPSITSTILGIEFLNVTNVINFFKPYHARLVGLELAFIVNNPLEDSLVIEDRVIEERTEVAIDFDVADSTACVICSDSTCYSSYSRETYDCGSEFDIGASCDGDIIMTRQEIIDDSLNCHIGDSSSFLEILAFGADGTTPSLIVVSGGFDVFDGEGTFDCTFGNDLVEITVTDI